MESVIHHEVKSIICGCSEVIHCEPEQAGLKTAGPHITSAQDLDAPWESGIIYLRITVSAKVNTQLKIMFKMTLLKIYCFTPFLPSSACLSLHSAPSFLPIFLCFLGKVQSLSSLLPFICFHRDHMNVQKKECVFVTHILPQKVCKASEEGKAADLWTLHTHVLRSALTLLPKLSSTLLLLLFPSSPPLPFPSPLSF